MHFPYLASDISLPTPNWYGTIYDADGTETYLEYNMSAQVAEGNGYGTLSQMNKYVRTLMKGENVLEPETVTLMQTDGSPGDERYSLGCDYRENLGYGHNGARLGNLSLMAYDPDHDVSVAVYLPLWDLTRDEESFLDCYYSMYDAAYAAREVLGYPGHPQQ
jgi:D-alanyl-D-alanine carboxypeptidase